MLFWIGNLLFCFVSVIGGTVSNQVDFTLEAMGLLRSGDTLEDYHDLNRAFSTPLSRYINDKGKKIVERLHCKKDIRCSQFRTEFNVDVRALIRLLVEIPDHDQFDLPNQPSVSRSLLSWLYSQVNLELFFVISKLVPIIREDCSQSTKTPNVFDMMLEKCALGRIKEKPLFRATLSKEEKWRPNKTVDLDFQDFSPVKGTIEEALDYWREDLLLHAFHQIWHVLEGKAKEGERYGEMFLYVHQQILHRYFLERHFADLPKVKPLRISKITKKIKTFYQYLDQGSPTDFKNNVNYCTLSDVSIFKKAEENITGTLHWEYDKFGSHVMREYHNLGHNEIAKCTSDGSEGMMSDTLTSARQPIFYRWHTEVERMNQLYKNQSVYTYEEIKPAEGVHITHISVISIRKTNVVKTFYEKVTIESPELKHTIHYRRLDHEDFNITVRLKNLNTQNKNQHVMARIFLIAKDFWPQPKWFIEMDRVLVELNGRDEYILRWSSANNSLTSKDSEIETNNRWPCGWPHNLYLPRGRMAGKVTQFKVVVFVHDVAYNQVDEGKPGNITSYAMFCGAEEQMKYDNRSFGFPLDKKWDERIDMSTVLDNNSSTFGFIAVNLFIQFQGEKVT